MNINNQKCPACGAEDNKPVYKFTTCYREPQHKRYMAAEGYSQDADNLNIYYCNNCSMVFRKGNLSESVINMYKGDNVQYPVEKLFLILKSFFESEVMKRFESEKEWILKYADLKQNASILDVGTGEGAMVKVFQESGYVSSGIEPVAPYATVAKERFNLNIKNDFYNSNSYYKESFDLITATCVLYRFENITDFFVSAREHLRTGGYLYTRNGNIFNLTLNYLVPSVRVYFSLNTIEQIANRYGFILIAKDYDIENKLNQGCFSVIFQKTELQSEFKWKKKDNFKDVRLAMFAADYSILRRINYFSIKYIILIFYGLYKILGSSF